jgi:hypothetical protein
MSEASLPVDATHHPEAAPTEAAAVASSACDDSIPLVASPLPSSVNPVFDGVDKDAVSQAIAAALSAVALQQQQECEQQIATTKPPKSKKSKRPSSSEIAVADTNASPMLQGPSKKSSSKDKTGLGSVAKGSSGGGTDENPILLLDDNGACSLALLHSKPDACRRSADS